MSPSTSASFGSRFTAAACLLIAVTLATAHSATAQDRRPIQANDLYRIRTAGDVAISPDGEQVAFVVTQIDSAADAYYSHLWLAGMSGRSVRQLTRGAVRDRDPAWSPDGSKIAFVSGRGEGGAQIYILPLEGGEPWALTDLENGASNPVWSPDGSTILFASSLTTGALEEEAEGEAGGAEEDEREDEAAMWGSLAAIRAWLAKNAEEEEPAVITRLRFQGERGLNPIEYWDHIYAIDLENGEPRRLTDGPYDFFAPTFSPDGRQIAFIADITDGIHPDYSLKNELYIMDAEGGEPRMIDIPGYNVFNPSWSPDGTHIAFAARDTTEPSAANTMVGVLELLESGLVGNVEWVRRPLDRGSRQYHWSADGSSIYFSAGVHGTVPIYRAPLHDGQIRQVVSGERGVLSFDLAAEKLAFVVTQPANPSEVYVANVDGDDERRLTNLNSGWLSGIIVQPHRGFWYESFDGRRVQGWLIEPVGYNDDDTYPLAVEIHGGPHAMWGPGERTMWHEFQLLAANGYFVLYTNPRGSGGYGYDFKYVIQRAWGDGPMRDVLTAVDSIVARGIVDEDRMVVTGGSYAGYLTAYLVGHDHRFAAAVAQRGVYDLATFFGEGNAWMLVPFEFNAYPWEDPDVLRRESPITYAHQIETPLLIIHSDRDLRTGVSQSEMLYRTLKVLDKPVEYVRYPREGHELSRSGEPLLRIDRLLRILEFFQRHVRPDL
ncbi:MAG: prolyl oligopeptidase family serine peptidase [Gemmatimonadetes bacterium]|nr:prolyl oligopeptidase family serine peptidase [Gemmatimonadota bacterium]NIO32348.1 prolyl oligopeptidase family serine peptidase [Gemmatimonadota bacterium]